MSGELRVVSKAIMCKGMILSLLGLRVMNPVSLRGKRVWIIGASSGLGAALAIQCAHDGAIVALSARRQSDLEQVQAQMAGDNHLVLPLDVTDMPSFRRAFERLKGEWESIDYVLYSSGLRPVPEWDTFKATEQLNGLDVNLGGIFRLLELMLPQWKQQGGGNLTLIGSLIATGAMPLAGSYGASKAGVAYLAENLRMDLADKGVQVQLVSPGFIDTPMVAWRPRKQMPCLMQPHIAAWKIRKLLGREDVFEIHFPKMLSVPTHLLRWLLPREWWMGLLNWAQRRTSESAPRMGSEGSSPPNQT
jgi:NAD(P)-dependent dehydrogenase (short-subunit alcohol dehydrogenase family)